MLFEVLLALRAQFLEIAGGAWACSLGWCCRCCFVLLLLLTAWAYFPDNWKR